MYPASDETVALKAAQGLREHLLADAGRGVAQLTDTYLPDGAVHADPVALFPATTAQD